MEKRKLCVDCGKRNIVVEYGSSAFMAVTLRWNIVDLCRQCIIKRIKGHIELCEKNLEKQRELLREGK